jgi:ATP-dependent Clp protease adapter protein ClpS
MSQHHADQPDVPRPPIDPPQEPRPQDPRSGSLPPYRVILHHDAGHDLMFVVRTVMELTRFCRAEATHKMWEAHHCGRSVLLVTYKERAELYAEQFQGRGLMVSIEPGD